MYPPPKSGRQMLTAAKLSTLHAVIGMGGGTFIAKLTPGPSEAAIAAVVAYQVVVAIAIYLVYVRRRSPS